MTTRRENQRSDDLDVPATDPVEAAEAGHSTGTEPVGASTDVATADAPISDDTAAKPTVASSIAGSTWVGLSIGAVILILLLVFILQNQDSVQLKLFVWVWNFPIGVGMLIAAIAGALVMACVGAVRILQLRRQINHPAKASRKS